MAGLLGALAFLSGFALGIQIAAVPLFFVNGLGATPTTAGYVLSIAAVAFLITPVWGVIGDKTSLRVGFAGAAITMAIGSTLYLDEPTLLRAGVGCALADLGLMGLFPAISAMAVGDKRLSYERLGLWMYIGSVIAPFVIGAGPLFVPEWERTPPLPGLMVACSLLCLALTIVGWKLLPKLAPARESGRDQGGLLSTPFLWLAVAVTFHYCALEQFHAFFFLSLEDFGHGAGLGGTVLGIVGLGGMIALHYYHRLFGARTSLSVVAFICFSSLPRYLISMFAPDVITFSAIQLLNVFGGAAIVIAFPNAVHDLIPPDKAGRAQVLIGGTFPGIGAIVGFGLGGKVFDAGGRMGSFGLASLFELVALVATVACIYAYKRGGTQNASNVEPPASDAGLRVNSTPKPLVADSQPPPAH